MARSKSRFCYSLNTLQILCHNAIYFGEVKFYFFKIFGDKLWAFALISLYSSPNKYLLQHTHDTLTACRYFGDCTLAIIDVKLTLSVIVMVPFSFLIDGDGDQYFIIEKIGLDVIEADDTDANK